MQSIADAGPQKRYFAAVLAVGAVAAAAALAPGDAYAQAHPECVSGASDCVYHVTRSFFVGDTTPTIIREDAVTGHVYVTTRPALGSADQNYSHLRIYDSVDNAHALIKDIRFNGTNSRIADVEINNATRQLYVAHLWGVGDEGEGWDGRTHNGDGRANLTAIGMPAYGVDGTVQLMHGEAPQGGGAATNVTRYEGLDLALDGERGIAYIAPLRSAGTLESPILAVNTTSMELAYAVVQSTAGITDPADGWDAYDVAAQASGLAVDADSGLVYAAARVGDRPENASHSWGIATLSFLDGSGMLTPNYTRAHFLNETSDPAPNNCPEGTYNRYPCNGDVLVSALHLDGERGQLFALYRNYSVWSYSLGAGGYPENRTHVDVRRDDDSPGHGEDRIHDMVLDEKRGLLHVSRYDYTDPRMVVINASNHVQIGVASLTSQPENMGLDPIGGAVYVLPQWAPYAYVVEAEPRSGLQRMIDDAAAGDTITVEAGIYDDAVLDIAKPLTLTSATGDPGSAKFTGYSRIEVEADNVTIRGLSFENTDCLPGYGGSLIEIRTQHGEGRRNLTIENNAFRDTCHAAIQKEGRGAIEGIAIRGNTFENIGLKLAPGLSEPLDTGGENEFQIMHGAIGLAHHPGQLAVGGAITGNYINGTSAAGIRVFKADGLAISDNYIANTPASAIGLAHSPMNVRVEGNTIVNANSEPDLDYLANVEGSGEDGYYRFIDLSSPNPLYLGMRLLHPAGHVSNDSRALGLTADPSPDAAISVWSNGKNIAITGNTIRGSDGALTVCTGVCAFESDGVVRERGRNIAANQSGGGEIRFTNNLVYAHSGPDNNGVLIRADGSGPDIYAGENSFPGYGRAADVPVSGQVNLAANTTGVAGVLPAAEAARCPSAGAGGGCTYHATAAFTAGDIHPDTVRVDSQRGVVYVATSPGVGAMRPDQVVLRAYEANRTAGYPLIKEFAPAGAEYPRIPAMEIDVEGRALYVVHAYNHSLRIGEPSGSHNAYANLSRIGLDSMEIEWSTQLSHVNRDGERNYRYDLYGIELDPANNAAFVFTEGYRPDNERDRNASPVLVASTGNGSLHEAVFHAGRHPYNYTLSPSAIANPSGIAANLTGSHTAYVMGRAGSFGDPVWGIATVSFDGGEGATTPDYEVLDFVPVVDNPDNHHDYYHYDIKYPSVLARDMILDDVNDGLFVLFRNGTLLRYDVGSNASAGGIGYPRSPEKIAGLPGDVRGIGLDVASGILYAASYDWQRPQVYAYRANDTAAIGVSSLSDQLLALTVDQAAGAVYVSPSWTPSVYVIEPQPRTALQAMIDDAPASTPGRTTVVTVPDGTYDDAVLVIDKPLTLTSTTGAAGPATFTGHSRIQVQSDNVAIRGLSFEDTDCLPGLAYNHIGIHNRDARSNVTVEDNRFAGTCHAAVQTKGAGALDNARVRFNTLENVGTKIAPGKSEPLDTGGEDEYLYTHGGIGLSYHPGQLEVRNTEVSYNDIRGTSSAGIRVFNPQDVRIVGNYIEDTPAAGIALAHNRNYDDSSVTVRANTIVNANSEPDFDYLDGVDGSGELPYYRAIGLDGRSSLAGPVTRPHPELPTPSAAIKVWANLEGVEATDNVIRGSGGAFVVCAGTCAVESDGIVHDGPDDRDRWKVRNILLPSFDDPGFESYSANATANRIAFNWNVIHADNDRDGRSHVIANNGTGTLDATNNYYPGMLAAGQVRSGATVDYAAASARSVASVSSEPGPGAAVGIGGTLGIGVEFSTETDVDTRHGTPYLLLGGAAAAAAGGGVAEYRGTAGRTMSFEYAVGEGDNAGHAPPVQIMLNGAMIDAEPNPGAALLLPAAAPGSIAAIDGVRPHAVNVTSASPATYYAGDTIEIRVAFNENVTITGAAGLPLGDGRAAAYAGGNGTGELAFAYAVQAGDAAGPLPSPVALSLAAGGAIRDAAGNDAELGLPAAGSGRSLAETSPGIAIAERSSSDVTATAMFTGPSSLRVRFSAPVGAPPGHAGPVYGNVTVPGGAAMNATGESGVGTAVHTVQFGGDGVAAGQTGAITLNTDLEGRDADGVLRRFSDDAIPVGAGTAVLTVEPSGGTPVVELERGSFVREIEAVGGADGGADGAVSLAVNVTGLQDPVNKSVVALPSYTLTIRTPFVAVSFPPNTTAMSVPDDGLIDVYVSDRLPTAEAVAAALGVNASTVTISLLVELGDNATHITFDKPVRILLDGQAGTVPFYVANLNGSVVPIRTMCASDDAGAVHAQLAGTGECHIDLGKDKAVHTYHLTRFGTASVPTALEAMVEQAPAGGTVAVAGGTYAMDRLVVNKSLTIEAADPADPPVLTGSSHIVVRPADADGPIVIRGIAFAGTGQAPDGTATASIAVERGAGSSSGTRPANSTAAAAVVIEGNTFRSTCGSAIRAAAGGGAAAPIADMTVRDNRFYDIGTNASACAAAPGRADAIEAGAYNGSAGGRLEAGAAQLSGMAVVDNYIFGTTGTGMRIAGADGLLVEGNHVQGTADDGIRVMQSRDVLVRSNAILGANLAPNAGGMHGGAAGGAVEVWSGSDDVAVSLNRISGSAGALAVCAGTCHSGSGTAAVPRHPINSDGGLYDIRFNHNILASSNTGDLVTNNAGGMLNARANYYPGYAASAAGRSSDGVAVVPALGGAGPVRIGAIVADGAGSDVRSVDSAVRAGFVLGAHEFNAMQAASGGFVGLEPVVQSVASAGYAAAARSEHAAALAELRRGAADDGGMFPVLEDSIADAMGLYDARGDAALAEISLMNSTYGHYPFALSRDGAVLAHGSNRSLVNDTGVVPALAGGRDGLRALFDFGDGSAMSGIGAYRDAPWKWWSYGFANPETGGTETKRSVIALHHGPDGTPGNADDIVFGAGYYPGAGASHLVVAAGDAAAAVNASDGMVIVSPTSTADALAARDMLFRLSLPDRSGIEVLAGAIDGDGVSSLVVLADEASLQSRSLAASLNETAAMNGLPDGMGISRIVRYNSSAPGWAGAAAEAAGAAVSSAGRADVVGVVYTGRAGALADLAAAVGAGSPSGVRWYATGELARAELASSPEASSFAQGARLKVVAQSAEPSAANRGIASAIAEAGTVLDASTMRPAYAAYDASQILGSAIVRTASTPGAPSAVSSAMPEIVRTYSGALGGPILLDASGDLMFPNTYAVHALGRDGSWSTSGTLRPLPFCGIALEKGVLDFGGLAPGHRSRIDTQTVVNVGTSRYNGVDMIATEWRYDDSDSTLPASLTEYREFGRDGAFASLRPGAEIAAGLGPGGDYKVQFRLDLTGYDALKRGGITQTVTYTAECVS